ncbi:MAG: LCP family protein [Oscillospiraceae bacterium]|jgi:LCP family protein required for cell wall assembly|nr:LCP family protein [Oscillospiraceae bacterium]
MKISGKTGKSKHLAKLPISQRILRVIISIVVVIAALGIGGYAYLKSDGGAPPVTLSPTRPHAPNGTDAEAVTTDDGAAPDEDLGVSRIEGKYTFAVLGTDKVGLNTDVIMVATLDTVKHSLDVVNIPRDTLVNVSWSVKKANTLYANAPKDSRAEGAVTKLADILGYESDFYIVVSLDAFAAIVDAVGGVDFDVPRNMDYDDADNFSVHISKGPHHLNGKDALGVVRFRLGENGYATGDIGRIETQQKFLMTAAEQILAKKSTIKVTDVAKIFLKHVKTNLSLDNLKWFAQELFKLDKENISFTTLPANTNDRVNGSSYVTIYIEDWLKLINEKLNPFSVPITLKNVSIYTRDAKGNIYVTDGHYEGNESWGKGGSSSSTTTPKPTVTPTPVPSETPPEPTDGDASPLPTDGTGGTTTTPTPNYPEVTEAPTTTPAEETPDLWLPITTPDDPTPVPTQPEDFAPALPEV